MNNEHAYDPYQTPAPVRSSRISPKQKVSVLSRALWLYAAAVFEVVFVPLALRGQHWPTIFQDLTTVPALFGVNILLISAVSSWVGRGLSRPAALLFSQLLNATCWLVHILIMGVLFNWGISTTEWMLIMSVVLASAVAAAIVSRIAAGAEDNLPEKPHEVTT